MTGTPKHLEPALPLFAYGTLANADVLQALYGMQPCQEAAVLPGWGLAINAQGYFCAIPDPSRDLPGHLVWLTVDQLHRADQWEEIPYYRRAQVTVRCPDANGNHTDAVAAWIYVQDEAGVPCDPGATSSRRPLQEVIADAGGLRRTVEASPVPFADTYVLVPCVVERPEALGQVPTSAFGQSFATAMGRCSAEEFAGTLAGGMRRKSLGSLQFALLPGGDGPPAVARAELALTTHDQTGLSVLTVALPATSIPVLELLDQLASGRLLEGCDPDAPDRAFDRMLREIGLVPTGVPRAAVFLQRLPDDDRLLVALLASEANPMAPIVGPTLMASAAIDVAQYSSASIRVSPSCVVEVPARFAETYEARLPAQILTLFIVELVLLQDAALSRCNRRIQQELWKRPSWTPVQALAAIEELGGEFAAAMTFWDIRAFRYRAAQALADEIARGFEIDKEMATYTANKGVLEQLISVTNARMGEEENARLNRLLLLLAVVQALPTLYAVALVVAEGTVTAANLAATGASVATCAMLWLVFRVRRRQSVRRRSSH